MLRFSSLLLSVVVVVVVAKPRSKQAPNIVLVQVANFGSCLSFVSVDIIETT